MSQQADILLLNANTSAAMTDRMVRAARRLHPPCRGATVQRGARYISDERSAAVATRAVLDFGEALTPATRPDVLVVSCFGDPGLWPLRARLPIPVIGMAEASCHTACQTGARFGIVTGGAAWGPMLTRFVAQIGLAARLSGIHIVGLTGDQLATDPATALPLVADKIAEAAAAGADSVILGGAGLVGFADRLAAQSPVPLLDSLSCAVAQAVAIARLRQSPVAPAFDAV